MKPPRHKISLSTCWCSHRHKDGYEMLCEIADLGYEYVELSHGIPVTLLPGIFKALNEKLIQVSSVHNFCPLPPGVYQAAPNYFEPSHPSPRESQLWQLYTNKSLSLANQVESPYLVLHSGSIPFLFRHPSKRILKDLGNGQLLKKQYSRIQRKAEKYQHHTNTNLSEVAQNAKDKQVKFAVENRELPHELPLDYLISNTIENLDNCVYWHDTGHAHIKETMGIVEQKELLKANINNLAGFHIKDANDQGQDNFAIGKGAIDFNIIRKFAQPQHTFVVEMGCDVTPEEIIYAREFIKNEIIAC